MTISSASNSVKYSDNKVPLFVSLVDGYPQVFAPLTEAGKLWQETSIYLNELDPDRALLRDEDKITDIQKLSSQGSSVNAFYASHSCETFYTLRIVYSMRYNASHNRASAQKAARAGVVTTYTNLTQPTEWTGELGWLGFYHKPVLCALGGSHQGLSDASSRKWSRVPYEGVTMETQIQTTIPRIHVVSALTKLRQDWQDATAGRSLISIDGNVALLLVDVAMSIGLDTIEQVQVFGVELAQELDETLAHKPGRNGRH